MPLRKSNRPISLIITREFNNVNAEIKSSSKEKQLSNLADFHLAGKNRYLKINQPEKISLLNKEMAKLKNPRVNPFYGDVEEDYERKKYVIEYREDEQPENKHNKHYSNSSTNETLSSAIDSDSDTKIDEHKVEKTFKMTKTHFLTFFYQICALKIPVLKKQNINSDLQLSRQEK